MSPEREDSHSDMNTIIEKLAPADGSLFAIGAIGERGLLSEVIIYNTDIL